MALLKVLSLTLLFVVVVRARLDSPPGVDKQQLSFLGRKFVVVVPVQTPQSLPQQQQQQEWVYRFDRQMKYLQFWLLWRCSSRLRQPRWIQKDRGWRISNPFRSSRFGSRLWNHTESFSEAPGNKEIVKCQSIQRSNPGGAFNCCWIGFWDSWFWCGVEWSGTFLYSGWWRDRPTKY